MYIADAGGNDLLSWTAEGGLQVVHAWPDNPVPTSVEVADNGVDDDCDGQTDEAPGSF